jgi:hypothetical protein
MPDIKIALRQVTRIDQSPMNPKQWCVQLSCGHDIYVTRAKKPKMKFHSCDKCAGEKRYAS